MAKSQNNVALVFGASGISGWAVTKNLLSYPSSTTFSRIIALTHRPRTVEDSGLPSDPRLELYSGIDLRASLDDVKQQMQSKIPGLEEVTQVYYLAYANATAYSENVMDIKDINVHMTSNAVHASDQLCTNMKFFLLQIGTNNYDRVNPPLKEDQPRIPSPWGDEIFYYPQVDLIKDAVKGKQWKWCEVRPDQIIGHVPAVTSMTYVEPIALYLSLYRYVNGPGARISFPGTKNFLYTYTDSSQDIITRAEIYLSVLEPEKADGEAFNIADTATPGPWSKKWPILASYFGLEGTGPNHAETGKEWGEIDKWWNEHLGEYAKMCEEYGLQERVIGEATWVFVKAGFMLLDRNREMSLDKIRSVGFKEELPVGHGHYRAFDQMALERIIPSRDTWAKKE
ncbi:SDR family oxidoreductase [Aspergillus stella-maris]|uniref:SDR family oxidoreductase n=1 Tax=Aspergillus stella-maris TaxID=1810926 RepID=UPI003CCDC6CE